MVIISKSAINQFAATHASAADALNTWYQLSKLADWKDFNALKQDMPSADMIANDRYIFNIKGNHYRLLALIHFATRTIYIRQIMTHAEYNKLRPRLPTL
jgi:mRNA interferase HigB